MLHYLIGPLEHVKWPWGQRFYSIHTHSQCSKRIWSDYWEHPPCDCASMISAQRIAHEVHRALMFMGNHRIVWLIGCQICYENSPLCKNPCSELWYSIGCFIRVYQPFLTVVFWVSDCSIRVSPRSVNDQPRNNTTHFLDMKCSIKVYSVFMFCCSFGTHIVHLTKNLEHPPIMLA